MTKSNLERFTWITVIVHVSSGEPRVDTQGRNLEQQSQSSVVCWLAIRLTASHLPYTGQATCLGIVQCTVDWFFLYQLAFKKMPLRHATGHRDGGNSLTEVPFLQDVNLTVKISHHNSLATQHIFRELVAQV
jgi:hypothetical protein